MAVDHHVYRFGEFTLDVAERQLLRKDREVPLRRKAFDTIVFLVEHHGHLVTKDALVERVWPETSVSDAVLTHCVAEVRRALDDPAARPRYVRTTSGAGYRFVGAVEVAGPSPEPLVADGAAASPAPGTAVAVIPFVDLGPDPENEAFCDGLAEEIINGLSKVPALRVVAHSSSFQFKGRYVDAREIGRRLGIGSLVEGSVRRSGDRLRVSAQLIHAADGFHLWAEQYDRRLEDVFAIQEEIARAVLRALKVELTKGTREPSPAPRPVSVEAWEHYLRGRWFWHRRFAGGLQEAMDSFRRAIEVDPLLAPAHAGLSDCHSSLGIWAFAPPESVFPKAAALAARALELDDGLAEAHASLAVTGMFHEWDWAAAERDLLRAIDLSPGSALVRLWHGHYLSIVGRHGEAVEEVTRAQGLDPLSPVVGANLGWTLLLAGETERAVAELLRVLDLDPGNGLAAFYLGYALAEERRYGESIAAFERSLAATGGLPWVAESIGWVRALEGDRKRARAILRESEARRKERYVPASAIALVHLGLRDDARLFDELERAVAERDALMPWLAGMPCFDRVASEPRFVALLRRLGLARRS